MGAHVGQEFAHYEATGLRQQIWIEPQPGVFAQLRAALPDEPRIRAFNVACGSARSRATMHHIEGNRGLSDSLLEPDLALKRERWKDRDFRPGGTIEVDVIPLDDLFTQHDLDPRRYNLLCVDTQGFELEVLRGSTRLLRDAIDCLHLEVSTIPFYTGQCLLPDLDRFLAGAGFARVHTRWGPRDHGDAFYVRASRLTHWQRRVLAIFGPRQRGKRPSVVVPPQPKVEILATTLS